MPDTAIVTYGYHISIGWCRDLKYRILVSVVICNIGTTLMGIITWYGHSSPFLFWSGGAFLCFSKPSLITFAIFAYLLFSGMAVH